jgi:hypothetical protein
MNAFEILCAIVRGESAAMPSGDARDCLLAVAREHRVDRLVAWHTNQIDVDLRAEAMLEEVEVRELNRVVAGLESRGIIPLVLKGAALAHSHYPESWLRPRLDSDLLIPGSSRDLAIDVLSTLGYRRPPFITGELVMYQMPFERAGATGQTHAVDLHWRMANPQVLGSLPDYEELSTRAVTIRVRGQSMRTPCPVDALLLACVHRAAHHDSSDELLWLYDIHLLALRFEPEEWEDFVRLASRCQVRALCVAGLRAARRCFFTAIPANVLTGLIDRSLPAERSAIFLRRDLTRWERLLADLQALSYVKRVRLLTEHVLPPAPYIQQKYGNSARIARPWLYLRRLTDGLAREVIRQPRDTRSRSAASSSGGCD